MGNDIGSKIIIHLDMDAFYPAVEVLDHPELRGRPVIVGGGRERGVVSSASYEARRFGVRSAMPMARAMRLCPEGVFLPVRMERYREVSRRIFGIFHRFTPLVEPLSIDEAFLDVTGSTYLFGPPVEMATKIRKTVREETGLTVSAGIAPSKFVAKIASDMDKPDGLTAVAPGRVGEFLDPLPIEKMWGVGRVTRAALARLGIRTFRDLRLTPEAILTDRFGRQGRVMRQLAMGMDPRAVIPDHAAKSIGHEKTFSRDILDAAAARKALLNLADKVARRMRRAKAAGGTVTLKVKYADFRQITRSETLPLATDDGREIYLAACRLLKKTEVGRRPVRLLGISLSRLSAAGETVQLDLFGRKDAALRKKRLNRALDRVAEKHGDRSLRPGTLIQ
ncbi:MAG: DNA polymerase IV [Deltaproteobacteria bacterium]|nr:MAG: DNA polymerase IV [Deltaproteobacteria bacterium]